MAHHLILYFRWAEFRFLRNEVVTRLLALDHTTFLDYSSVRWVLAALAGTGLGCAIGRSSPLASSGSVPPEPAARAEDPGLKVPAEERPSVPS